MPGISLKAEQVKISNDFLMNEKELDFFHQHIHADIHDLLLKLKTTARQKEILQQIARRQNIKNKLPFFYRNMQIYYPQKVSLEQCSSEKTAIFKSTLFSGNTFIDLTAGMGIDSYYISGNFRNGILIEPNETLAHITSHNMAVSDKRGKISIVKGENAASFLKKYTEKTDLIYMDPSRRNEGGGKVFRLEDCEPDVVNLLPDLLRVSDRILIKTSPLLDIALACKSLQYVRNVYVLSLNNECRELLFDIENNYTGECNIHAVNLDNGSHFTFNATEEKRHGVEYTMPLKYLYEPGVSLLKAGAFNSIARKYAVSKLHTHSHLYTSAALVRDFPGRIFEIKTVMKAVKNDIQKSIQDKKANITIRNFPGSVAELRKKWQLAEGGEDYIFATTLCTNEKSVLLCNKISL